MHVHVSRVSVRKERSCTDSPMVDLRLLGNRLFRSGNGVIVLASIAFLGTLYAVSLYYQDGHGLSALGSRLSTFPEALGVMGGAQLTSRVVYPRLGPRCHISIGLTDTAASIGLLALMGTADQPVVGTPAHAHSRAVHGPGVRSGAGGGFRHYHVGGYRPGIDDVQRDPATRRGRADYRHRPRQPGSPGRRVPDGQPHRLPRCLRGGRRDLPLRPGVLAVIRDADAASTIPGRSDPQAADSRPAPATAA